MSKKLKILLILLISFVLVSFSTSTYAVNMDLTDDEGSTSNEETSKHHLTQLIQVILLHQKILLIHLQMKLVILLITLQIQ